MDELNFKTGDVVMLKSGGPRMTVWNPHDGFIRCRWYEGPDAAGNYRHCEDSFMPALIELVPKATE